VASNEQLIEAMQNPSIGTIELQAGNYPYLNYQAEDGDRVVKAKNSGGNRETLCQFQIIAGSECFIPSTDPLDPFYGFSSIAVNAFFVNPGCGDCCPPNYNDGWGYWSVTDSVPGSTVIFENPGALSTFAYVDMAGSYVFRYSWPDWDSEVETYYLFYGPITLDLEADNICEADGLTTPVTFTLESAYEDPFTVVQWTLDGLPYDGPDESGTFDLTVSACGPHVLAVTADPRVCPPVYKEIVIWFDCEPTAYAGPDVSVCNDMCVFLDGSVSVALQSPSFAYSWVNVDGPQGQTLTFSPKWRSYGNGCHGLPRPIYQRSSLPLW
jgi:hypothetical protein